MLYLQMDRVMLLCYHYTPECLPEQEGFILYISKVTNYIWKNAKKINSWLNIM